MLTDREREKLVEEMRREGKEPLEPLTEARRKQIHGIGIGLFTKWQLGCGDDYHEATEAIRDLLAALTVAEEAFARREGWQPIETAPIDGTPLLLFARAKHATAPGIIVGWYLPNGEGWIEACFGGTGNHPVGIVPSHWMPLQKFPDRAAIRAREEGA